MEAVAPPLPHGRRVELRGRGTTFIREIPGPPGAPTVVLLHGWTATADLNWFTCYQALGARFHVLAVDHRGHGQGIRSNRRFRLADCADDVAALCDTLGVDRIIPVGYSMGGPIAMLTWHRHRDLVEGLVLCATSPYFARSATEERAFSMLSMIGGAARLTPRSFQRQAISRFVGDRVDTSPLGVWAKQEMLRGVPHTIAEAGASLGRFDARPWLGEIDVPTVVVRTTMDSVVPPRRQSLLATEIPGARVLDVQADHGACVMASDRFVPGLVRAVDHTATLAVARRPIVVP